jgi:hypothetical protein
MRVDRQKKWSRYCISKRKGSELRDAGRYLPQSVAYTSKSSSRPQPRPLSAEALRPEAAPTPTRGQRPQNITLFFPPQSSAIYLMSPHSDHPAATRATTRPGFVKHVKNIGRAYRKQATVLVACYKERILASEGCGHRSDELRR